MRPNTNPMKRVYGSLAAMVLALLPLTSEAQTPPTPVPAEANPFCPASIGKVVAVHQVTIPDAEHDLGTDNEFAIQLEGNGPATLTGTIELLSKNQLYVVPFTNATFQPFTRNVSKNGVLTAAFTSYMSEPIYVTLPVTGPLDAAWVATVTHMTGTNAAGWCPSEPIKYGRAASFAVDATVKYTTTESGHAIYSSLQIRTHAPKNSIAADPLAPLDTTGCANLYTPAMVLKVASPLYPRSVAPASGTTLVRLAIDASGTLVNTSTAQSSGWVEFDDAARVAAAQSTFRPAQFWCSIPVPGYYLFRAHFLK